MSKFISPVLSWESSEPIDLKAFECITRIRRWPIKDPKLRRWLAKVKKNVVGVKLKKKPE